MTDKGGDERKRVLFTAVRLNRADVIKAVATGSEAGDKAAAAAAAVDPSVLDCLDDSRSFTPLHAAIDYGHMDALRMLLRLGADVAALAGGRTPVQLAFATDEFADAQQVFVTEAVQAIAAGDQDRLQLLLAAGLPPEAEIGHGASSTSLLAWAKDAGEPEMLAALEGCLASSAAAAVISAQPAAQGAAAAATAGTTAAAAPPPPPPLSPGSALDADIAECRAYIAALLEERDALNGVLAARGTDRVVAVLRDVMLRVRDAHAALEEQEAELAAAEGDVARARDGNAALQAELAAARAARSSAAAAAAAAAQAAAAGGGGGAESATGELRRGERVLYVKSDAAAAAAEAEVVKVHLEDPQSPYYTVRLLETGQERNTTAAHLRRHGAAAGSSGGGGGAANEQQGGAHNGAPNGSAAGSGGAGDGAREQMPALLPAAAAAAAAAAPAEAAAPPLSAAPQSPSAAQRMSPTIASPPRVAGSPASPQLRRAAADRRAEERRALLAQLMDTAGELDDEVTAMRALAVGAAADVVRRISRLRAEAADALEAARESATAAERWRAQAAALQRHGAQLSALLQAEARTALSGASSPIAAAAAVAAAALPARRCSSGSSERRNGAAAAAHVPIDAVAALHMEHMEAARGGSGEVEDEVEEDVPAGRRGRPVVVSAYDDASLESALMEKARSDQANRGLWVSLLGMLFGWKPPADQDSSSNPIFVA